MISWGDIATWVGSIGTVSAFIVAFIQISIERKARKQLEQQQCEQQIRDQAEHISAWVDTEVGGGQEAVIAILNRSNEPVYQVIVTIVAFQGNSPYVDSTGYNRYRGFVSIVPPSRVFVKVPGGYRGMGFHPSVEIVFVDKANKNWVRRGNGELITISKKPDAYYNLQPPLSWQLPKTLESPTSH